MLSIRPKALTVALLTAAALGAAVGEESATPLTLAGLGDCEKITKDGAIPESPLFWDATARKLKLHGGRNEVVAAQLMLVSKGQDVKKVNVIVGDLKGPGTISADPDIQLSLELYQYVKDGSYSWGPPSQMLPSKKWYPEVLAPFADPYGAGRKPVGAPFDLKTEHGPNQGVWIDVYVPKDAKPGRYEAPVRVTVGDETKASATLELTVHDFSLPDESHVDGYGEFYGLAYGMHGVSCQKNSEQWWAIARRYHQMAHQHRFVICERMGAGGPDLAQLDVYDRTLGTVLDGTAFSKEQGYVGLGESVGPSFWLAPFAQAYDGKVPDFPEAKLKEYGDKAKAFWDHVVQKKWDGKRFFAYIIDEAGSDPNSRANTKKLQDALDAGTGGKHINLMWTSHTNPATLADNPATDLRGLIRWWSPNAGACDPGFLAPRVTEGETVWFYHHGHPNCGVHAVNATGIDLRTWGTICWRYKLNGSFWWAMDLGDKTTPLARPVYKPDDTRWGNGVLFYPGCKLPDVGLPAIDGPLSCLRMKAYRRGLQDYEYCWLLQQARREAFAHETIKKVIPAALAEASGKARAAAEGDASARGEQQGGAQRRTGNKGVPAWSADVSVWYRMRQDLAAELDRK